jgi:hypothetical protein
MKILQSKREINMGISANRTSEAEIAFACLRVAASRSDGLATYPVLKKEVPTFVSLTDEDRKTSLTRLNEELWEQKIRNIKSHFNVEGNIISEGYAEHVPNVGYRITASGRAHLKNKGY